MNPPQKVNCNRYKLFFLRWPFGFIDRTAEDLDGMRETGGVKRSKGPRDGSQTQVHCSENKASVHGTPALPTELNGTPTVINFNI